MKGVLKLGMERALSLGITALGSNDSDGSDFDALRDIYREIYDEAWEARLPAPRMTMQCGINADLPGRGIPTGTPLWEHPQWGALLKMGSAKLFADGTLGGQTAWMRRPYRDKPETRGFPVLEPEELHRLVRKAAGANLQVTIHAIGDAGVELSIAAFEGVTAPGHNPLRHGIIHCQITAPDLLERMARNGILALVQPGFLADDLYILESRVGPELAATSYAWGSMARLGIPVSYGTDAPVSSLNPLLGIEWAVLRQDPANNGYPPGGFYPAERVDVYTALDAYTRGSAFAGFAEDSLGRIAPGYLADLVFLDRNIFAIPPEEIHQAKVLRTMMAGETVYSSERRF
jgi:predicted amidohydrolase YtcJ